MRTATCIIGEKNSMTVGDLKKILKRMDDSAPVHVQSHFMGGTYNVGSEGVTFDDKMIVIGG